MERSFAFAVLLDEEKRYARENASRGVVAVFMYCLPFLLEVTVES